MGQNMSESEQAMDFSKDFVEKNSEAKATSEKKAKLVNRYLTDKRSWLIAILFLQALMLASCVLYMVYDWYSRPKPMFFARNNIGQLVPSKPLTEPSMETAALLNWVTEAVVAAYSFNFVNIQEHPTRLSAYFDENGYKRVIWVLTRDHHMSRVIKDKLIVSAVAAAAPEVVKDGLYKNEYYVWIIKLPLEVSYSNKVTLRRQSLEIQVIVKRVPETDNPIGVRITNFVVKVKSETQPTVNLLRRAG